jgi:OOP family OmpA-OmpF porin
MIATLLLAATLALPAGNTPPINVNPNDFSADELSRSLESSVEIWLLDEGVTSLATTETSDTSTTLTLGTDVLFDFAKDQLDGQAVKTLGERLDDIPRDAEVRIVGHTDSIGSTSDNLDLSKRRAQAVAKALADARSDLTTSTDGKGESDPVADNGSASNDNPAGRAKNRRVELTWQK